MNNTENIIEDLSDKTIEEREAIATRVGKAFSQGADKVELAAAERLLEVLVLDAAENVRSNLVKEVLNCEFLPFEVAKKISNDVVAISENFLHHYVGEDALLEKLARECEEQAREILAQRHGLPEPASFAISEVGAEKSISNLMENKTAIISDRVCTKVTDRFLGNKDIMEHMSKREDLSMASVVLLIDFMSQEVAAGLVKNYNLGEDLAHYIAGQAQITAVGNSLENATDQDIRSYFKSLKKDGLLNDGKLIQILKSSGAKQFSIAISIRSGIEGEKVEAILNGGDKGHFTRLLEKAKISEALIAIIYGVYLEVLNPPPAEEIDVNV